MFVDKVEVLVQAGNGGNGAVNFRHEKFIDRGGPDGGDGGDGGDVILLATRNQHTLAAFRYKKELKATDGKGGSKQRKHGKSGENLVVHIPTGTVATTVDGIQLADLTEDGQQVVIAEGGKGGFGNAHFVSSVRQAPRVAEKGEKGIRAEVILELKMIADVGLIGLPNAGKSTLLSVISNAHPDIAGYPFTTLKPNLGVVDIFTERSLLVADIPGLIEGASHGKGLGDDFLRHVERTAVLIHLIDVREDVASAYKVIQKELGDYRVDLTNRPQLVVLSKIDGFDSKELTAKKKALTAVLPKKTPVFAISSHTKQGIPELLDAAMKMVETTRIVETTAEKEPLPVIRLDSATTWQIHNNNGSFVVTGKQIERFAARTDFDNSQGVQRLRSIMQKQGIMRELHKKGIAAGARITIGDPSVGSLEY